MSCLDENQALLYVAGTLSSAEQRAIEAHVARCDDCRFLLSAAGAAALDEIPSGEATRPAGADAGRLSIPGQRSEERTLGEVLLETYVIERHLGQGGFGIVYEAAHRRLKRKFAIKFLFRRWSADRVALARLKREAEVTSQLSHPNIVEIVDFNYSDDGVPFIVMELLEGESLEQRLRREGTLDLAQVEAILLPVASALAAAHGKGIVHRDLKPSNIFLARKEGMDLLVKVVDFGIAKIVDVNATPDLAERRPALTGVKLTSPELTSPELTSPELTSVQAVMGTPRNMAPEQALGRSAAVDHRADIFSLGTILYQMVTGHAPFTGSSATEMLTQVIHEPPTDSAAWRALPRQLRRVILRSLSKAPADRQQSATQLAEELSSTLREIMGQAASSRGGTRREPDGLRRSLFPRERRLVLSAVLLLALGLAALLWRAYPAGGKREAPGDPTRQLQRATRSPAPGPPSDPDAGRAPLAIALQGDGGAGKPPGRTPRSPRATVKRSWGSMIVQTKIKGQDQYLWADVYLDGRHTGQTALTLERVAAGVHRVEVRRSGYSRGRRRVWVRAGKPVVVLFELQPLSPSP